MGNKNGKEKEEESNGENLSRQQLTQLKELYLQIAQSKNEKTNPLSANLFKEYIEKYLDDWLSHRVSEFLSIKQNQNKQNSSTNTTTSNTTSIQLNPAVPAIIPFSNFTRFVHIMLRGEDCDVKVSLIWEILGVGDDQNIKAEDILKYVKSIVESYLKMIEKTPNYLSWIKFCEKLTHDAIDEYAKHILSDLFWEKVQVKEILSKLESYNKSYTKQEISRWLQTNSQFRLFQSYVFSECFKMDPSLYSNLINLIPKCQIPPSLPKDSLSFLNILQVLFLNSQISNDSLKKEWRLLFSTSIHGTSFSKFSSLILEKGPTLLIVKEERGRTFGGFANTSWKFSPKFYGGTQSFLFHLDPLLVTYLPTGYNENFLYLNNNQQTMPNGLGMGGKLEYFGLWLDALNFGNGKTSTSCTTFSNPQLSKQENFTFNDLEVWGLGEEPKKDPNERDTSGKSILDKDPEAKMLLEMIDKRGASDGLRDEPEN